MMFYLHEEIFIVLTPIGRCSIDVVTAEEVEYWKNKMREVIG
jgi:hypothetical protein